MKILKRFLKFIVPIIFVPILVHLLISKYPGIMTALGLKFLPEDPAWISGAMAIVGFSVVAVATIVVIILPIGIPLYAVIRWVITGIPISQTHDEIDGL